MFSMILFQQDWSRVAKAMQHWFTFQQESVSEITDFLAAMSPQKDMAQILSELKQADAGKNILACMNFWLHPENSHQAMMELLEIFQAVEQRIKTSQDHATKVCLEGMSGAGVIMHQHSASPELLATLLEHQLKTAKSLKTDQAEIIGATSALQVALKAWGYRQLTEPAEVTSPAETA